MFELLFNHPLHVWREATLVFESGWPPQLLLAAILLAGLLIGLTLWRRSLRPARRWVVGALQGIAAAAVLTMLWQPALEVDQLRPGENAIAWLLDGSRSMQRTDAGQTGELSRSEAMREALSLDALGASDRFSVERHLIGSTPGAPAVRLPEGDMGVDADGEGSALASGLESLLRNVDDQGLAAVVVIGDGANTEGAPSPAWWQSLAAAGVPVHTVGVGAVERRADVELEDVVLPERASLGASVQARLTIAHPPGAPTQRLRIERGDVLVHAEDIDLSATATRTQRSVRFVADEAGLSQLSFTLRGPDPDTHPTNDRQQRLLRVDDARRRVLYVEGEPRWEFKFLRRAAHDDPELEIVSLLRTSANKFYRQGVRDASELADGFPANRDALFAYDAVIIGSFAAAELNAEQQAALRDFVSVRGGSLLMLAGRRGLADGGWARSAVAAAMPVALDTRLDARSFRRERVGLRPTRQGLRRDWLALSEMRAPDESATARLADWDGLPQVADRQSVGQVKPGAVVLIETDDGEPVWVTQRYGRGESHVFGTSGTWRWQMGLPSDDQRHERFWRNALARLVVRTPERVGVEVAQAVQRDGAATAVRVRARDLDFTPLSGEALRATVIAPDGSRSAVSLVGDLDEPGAFDASVAVDQDGPWAIEVTAAAPGESPGAEPLAVTARWLVERDTAEDFGWLQDRAFLQRIAEVSGGEYLPLERVDELPALLERNNAAATRQARLPLWNMPFLFLLIGGARALEWLTRLRWKRV